MTCTSHESDALSRGEEDFVWRIRCEDIATWLSEQLLISAYLLVAGQRRPHL